MDVFIGLGMILFGLAAAGFGVHRLMNTSEAIRKMRNDSEAMANQAAAEVLQLENALDSMTRRLEDRKANANDLTEKLKDVGDLLSPEEREKRRPIYIANDRRNKGDPEFRAKISSQRLTGDWRTGREYVVWAKDEEFARRAFETKFPPAGSFVIEDVRKSRDPL
jgi:hypothetical protein